VQCIRGETITKDVMANAEKRRVNTPGPMPLFQWHEEKGKKDVGGGKRREGDARVIKPYPLGDKGEPCKKCGGITWGD